MNQKRLLLFSTLFLLCFLLVAYFRQSFNAINLSVNLWSASFNNGSFTLAAQTISVIFDTISLIVLLFALAILLFILHKGKYGLLLLGAMAGEALLVTFVKFIIISPRPVNEIIVATGNSFPSGHTTSCVVFFGVLTFIVWSHFGSFKIKASSAGLYVSVTALVAFDRIYLNVHWLSDILGAVFLGAFWLTLVILIFKLLTRKKTAVHENSHSRFNLAK